MIQTGMGVSWLGRQTPDGHRHIMNQNFDKCMEMLLQHEGGFVDGNKIGDPGGLTNMGVTKKTWDDFYGDDIDEQRMRNITVEDIKPIYRTNYWDRCRCQDLPSGVDWAVFDWAVNSGPGRAAKALQKAVGAFEDGVVGPQTLMAVNASQPSEIVNRMAVYRDCYYRSLGHFDKFGKGWLRRNDETRQQSLSLAARA